MSPWWTNLQPPKQQVRSRYLRNALRELCTEGGVTNHSSTGLTLAYLIRGLEEADVDYELQRSREGYVLTVKPKKGKSNA